MFRKNFNRSGRLDNKVLIFKGLFKSLTLRVVIQMLENGKPLRKTNLSRYRNILLVSFAPDCNSKRHRLDCSLQKSSSLLQKTFCRVFEVHPSGWFSHGRSCMHWTVRDSAFVRFQRTKRSYRRKLSNHFPVHWIEQLCTSGDRHVSRSPYSSGFSSFLSAESQATTPILVRLSHNHILRNFCLTPTLLRHINWRIPYDRPVFTRNSSSVYQHLMLYGYIFYFEEAVISYWYPKRM